MHLIGLCLEWLCSCSLGVKLLLHLRLRWIKYFCWDKIRPLKKHQQYRFCICCFSQIIYTIIIYLSLNCVPTGDTEFPLAFEICHYSDKSFAFDIVHGLCCTLAVMRMMSRKTEHNVGPQIFTCKVIKKFQIVTTNSQTVKILWINFNPE